MIKLRVAIGVIDLRLSIMVADGKTTPDAEDVSRRDACSTCSTCRREFEDKLQTWRRGLRGLYLAIALLGFGVGFYFTFISVPNMSVHRVYLDHGRQREYASRHLYNEHVSYGVNVDMEKRENEATMTSIFDQFRLRFIAENSASSAAEDESQTLTCPCTRTTLSWTDYTHFYFLTYTRPDGKPYVKYWFPSELDGRLGGIESDNASGIDPQYLTRVPDAPKTANDFCNLVNNLPDDMLIVESQFVDCRDLVGPILSSVFEAEAVQSRWKDSRASFYESPVLLHQKFFYSRTVSLLRSYLREKHLLMQSTPKMMGENITNRNIFLRGLTDIWVHVLDTFGDNSSCSDTDFFSAASTRTCQDFAQQGSYYPYHLAVMLNEGQTFLGMSMNWTEYYNGCDPTYCDVMVADSKLRRACTAVAVLGGLGTFVLVLVHLLIWPLSDTALIYFCRRSNHSTNPPPYYPANLQLQLLQRSLTVHGQDIL